MIFGQESETLEFKKTTAETKDAAIDVAAILNKHGRGELYFGIRNDGVVVGQTVSGSTLRDVSRALTENIKPQIYPTVEMVNIDYKDCIRVQFEGESAPYFAYGRAYIRVADECKQLSPAELEGYFKKKQGQISTWDSDDSKKTVEDINTNYLRSYLKRANECGRLDYKFTDRDDILRRLGLLEEGKLSNAAVAMFGKKPQTEIQMAIFATDVKHTFIDIDRQKGTISDLVDIGETYIRRNTRWRAVIDGSPQRQEIPEVPMVAVREALLNSYAHKDYRIPQTNEVAIYSNRIEIYNPGTFPEGLTPHDFIAGEGKSVRRNPLLAQIMYYSKDIESFGTGLQKIARECEGAGVRYEFILGKLGFSVVFYRLDISPAIIGATDNGTDNGTDGTGVNATALLVFNAIKGNSRITVDEILAEVSKSRRTVLRAIAALKDAGMIRRVGSERNGHWEITG
jgi:ATP-dependent DNA helicase RecG